jgi:lipopolysaccharide transport system ATP-binding protein
MAISIKAENLSKIYRLGEIGTGTVSHDLERWFKVKVLGQEDPFLSIGETNDRSLKGDSNVVYSLKDINFEITEGDTVGIIGKNGAGKSTLLKILSRVTSPTTGKINIKGRVASLLEVGTGFHPELTGRENIFLNGAILGMRKNEITRKLEEIIDFSGVERYIDTPVKRYSSGMYVRLAFAVAANLESEILIVDEVLAVGDAEFQKKCLGKMGEVSKGEGRTILFVSHNMNSILNLCRSGILMSNGMIASTGKINDVISAYSVGSSEHLSAHYKVEIPNQQKELEILEGKVTDIDSISGEYYDISDSIYIHIKVACRAIPPSLFGYVTIKNTYGEIIIESDTHDFSPNVLAEIEQGITYYTLKVSPYTLSHGEYIVNLCLAVDFGSKPHIDNAGEILKFYVSDSHTRRGNNRISRTSSLIEWKKI